MKNATNSCHSNLTINFSNNKIPPSKKKIIEYKSVIPSINKIFKSTIYYPNKQSTSSNTNAQIHQNQQHNNIYSPFNNNRAGASKLSLKDSKSSSSSGAKISYNSNKELTNLKELNEFKTPLGKNPNKESKDLRDSKLSDCDTNVKTKERTDKTQKQGK